MGKIHNLDPGLEHRAELDTALARVLPTQFFETIKVGVGRHRGSFVLDSGLEVFDGFLFDASGTRNDSINQ